VKVTVLGTGTSQGVPVIACDCDVCTSTDPRDKRLRVSVLIEEAGPQDSAKKTIVIDSGPDFRYQMLRAGVKHLDAILFTHEHKDHIAGLDDIRAFNYRQQNALNVYAHKRVHEALWREFHYAFSEYKYPGVPQIKLHEIDKSPFSIDGMNIIPIEVMHHTLPVLGFRIGDFTYITDAKTVSETEKRKIFGSKILILNALQKDEHISHFTLDEALVFAQEVGAEKTYLTHISHKMGKHEEVSRLLPPGIELAYDGMVFDL